MSPRSDVGRCGLTPSGATGLLFGSHCVVQGLFVCPHALYLEVKAKGREGAGLCNTYKRHEKVEKHLEVIEE